MAASHLKSDAEPERSKMTPVDVSVAGYRPVRRAYSSPVLMEFGRVKDIVKSGSGAEAENSGKDTNTNKFPTSERRLKEDIVRVGTHPSGIGLYLFNYKQNYRDAYGHGRHFGVMVDEVELVLPEAVSIGPHGYNQVDYSLLGIELAPS